VEKRQCDGNPIKDRLQVDAVQGREQQGDDCDKFRHANPPSSLISYVSLPDGGGFASLLPLPQNFSVNYFYINWLHMGQD